MEEKCDFEKLEDVIFSEIMNRRAVTLNKSQKLFNQK